VRGSEISAAAEKRSAIQIFDSYLEVPAKGKRIETIAVDDINSRSALRDNPFPDSGMINSRLANPIRDIPSELLERIISSQRGSVVDD